MTIEIFKDIPGYEGAYQVSNLGRVRSLERQVAFVRHGKTLYQKWPGKLLKFNFDPAGYPKVELPGNVRVRVHVLVALVFIGPRPDGLNILHKDDDKSNNKTSNLKYGTQSENVKDSYINGG